jgi:hypothetical protein
MSDNWLQLVPSDPQFRPDAAQAERARQLFASFVPLADDVSAEVTDEVRFFDPGGNWSGVECPAYGAAAQEWWAEAVSAAARTGFESLSCVAKCCRATVSLNELRYIWPAAFGSFALVAVNPNVPNLSATQLVQLEQELGCTLRVVWRHL